MSKPNKERKRLHSIYNRFYDRHYMDERYQCFYCGAPDDTLDHVPPLSWVEVYTLKYFRDTKTPVVTVPCCSECNTLLGDKRLIHIEERLRFLEDKYEKFLKKIVHWEDAEIEGMGYVFQSVLWARKHRETELQNKLQGVQQRLVKPWTWPDYHDLDIPED